MFIDDYLRFQDKTFYNYGNYAIVIFVIVTALAILFLWHLATSLWGPSNPVNKVQVTLTQKIENATAGDLLTCENGKSIRVRFDGTQAHLNLSDGREISLPKIVSDSSTKYSNPNGSFIFRSVSGAAFVAENGVVLYANCTAKP